MHFITSLLILLLAAATFLPLWDTNLWFVRYLDYPRLQIAVALFAVLVLHLLVAGRRTGQLAIAVLALGALTWQVWHLYRYTSYVPPVAATTLGCTPESGLSILVANVQRGNERTEPFLDLVAEVEPDVILAMETDEVWDRAFEPLSEAYPHRLQHVPGDDTAKYYGMHLLSRLPLVSPEMVFTFDEGTPTAVAGITLGSGQELRFHGVHPRPPHWFSQGTTLRDATLVHNAIEMAGGEAPAIMVGDFNAVPWEDVFRRTMRLGGLLDPRVGRGYLPTYDAQSALMSWPLDHVLFQDELTLVGMEVLPEFGSDHYPVLARLCHEPEAASRQGAPEPTADDLEEAQEVIAAAERIEVE